MTVMGVRLLLIATLVSVASTAVIREAGRCVTYGYQGDDDDGLVNGVNNTRAVSVSEPYPDLGSVCPSLANASALCCDAQQYQQLTERLQQATAILNRCQACYQNFREFWCQYTCSPDQSLFKEVTKTVKNDAGAEVVRDTNYYIESGYAQEFFDSCRNIGFGATGEKLFDMLFHSASTPVEWFNVLGSDAEHGGYSTEYIQFPLPDNPSPNGIVPLSSTQNRPLIVPCYTSTPRLACSCSDCPSACPSADILDLDAAIKPNTGRNWLLGILYIPTLLFILAVVFIAVSKRRFPVRRERRENQGWPIQFLKRFGHAVGGNPVVALVSCCFIVLIVAYLGLPRVELLQDPIKLWTPLHSEAFQSMLRNEKAFGPAFRVEQIIISTKDGLPLFRNDTTSEFVNMLLAIRKQMESVKTDDGVGFEDLCYRLAPGEPCVVQSVLGWFDTDESKSMDSYSRFTTCSNNNYQEDCFDRNGLPTLSNVALGGYSNTDYSSSTASVITILLNGAFDDSHQRQCEQWEQNFIHLLRNSLLEGLTQYRVSYSTQQSLQSELNSQTTQDAVSVILSYIIMFVYITFALGDCFPLRSLLRLTRAMLALVAISVVVMSVVAACAVCALAGIKMTLIISEVIPFIILAIGVDNIFLLSKSFQKQDPVMSPQERLTKTMADVGPSVCLTSLCESGAFLLGLLTTMPAVRAFACYAAVSVVINLFLQLTVFCAAMVLDAKWRESQHSNGLVCCFFWPRRNGAVEHYDPIQIFMTRYLSPFITKSSRARLICLVFCIISLLSMGPIYSNLQLGLDPSIALPSESYLQPYFHDVMELLRVGPPMYMTVAADFSDERVQNALCTLPQCNHDSLGEIINLASQTPDSTFIASGVSNWIDDYLQWLNPPFLHSENTLCCRKNKVTQQFCSADDFDDNCVACIDAQGLDPNGTLVVDMASGRPTSHAFDEFLPGFLMANCSSSCIFCASPHYHNLQVQRTHNATKVTAARFMAYHKVLASQRDFISALKSARSLSEKVSSRTSIPTYVDSVFYVFFEQYLGIEYIAAFAFVLALLFVTTVLIPLFRDLRIALATSATMLMILVDVVGTMALSNININAVSVVNLITCIGLSVEFCVPTIYHYLRKEWKSPDGMKAALSSTGSSVVRGILLTKVCGLVVLFASATRMIRVYYALMYALICIYGAAHGLIFLPALILLIDSPDIEESQPLLSPEQPPQQQSPAD